MKLASFGPDIRSRSGYLFGRSRVDLNPEAGDTLIEILVTLVIISLCVVAFLVAFTTSITASAKHRTFVSLDTALRTVSENAQSQIELQVNPLFVSCATPLSYQTINFGTPSGYTTQITSVSYWNGSSFASTCTTGSTAPQLVDISVTNSLGLSSSVSIVVDDPAYVAPASDTSLQMPRPISNLWCQSVQPTKAPTNLGRSEVISSVSLLRQCSGQGQQFLAMATEVSRLSVELHQHYTNSPSSTGQNDSKATLNMAEV